MSVQAFINGAWVDVADLVAPPGSITMFGGATPPGGWLLCNGQAVLRTQYASLFQAIGSNYGPGDGTTTFNLPDFRGTFPRGVDGGAGNDPDRTTRVAKNGGNAGDAVGSFQTTATKLPVTPFTMVTGAESASHSHAYASAANSSGPGAFLIGTVNGGGTNWSSAESASHTHQAATWGNGDHESRPPNLNVNFIIKT